MKEDRDALVRALTQRLQAKVQAFYVQARDDISQQMEMQKELNEVPA